MFGGTGLHLIPVNTTAKTPSWSWNGNPDLPTISPSILTHSGPDGFNVCHSFLTDGVFHFLGDCSHQLAGKEAGIPDLPEWFIEEYEH